MKAVIIIGLSVIILGIFFIHLKLNKMANELEVLKAKVAANKDVTQSAVLLLKGLKERLDAAIGNPAELQKLSEDLGSQTDSLASAITENTPAE